MSYHPTMLGAPDVATSVPHPMPTWLPPVLIGGVSLLIGFVVWSQYKIASKIAEKDGARGLLGYEAGKAGLSLLDRATRSR